MKKGEPYEYIEKRFAIFWFDHKIDIKKDNIH